MKQITLAFAAFFAVSAQLIAQDVTYVLFNRNCMNQLEYRYAYSDSKGDNSVWAYSIKPNIQEHYIFMTEGAGHYSPELPSGTVTCRNLSLDDAFAADINRKSQQMLIVFQRQSGGYWLMPVRSATLVARKGSRYWVRTQQSSFQFDTLRMVNEQNVAVAGSPTAAYFSGAKLNNCLMEYSFHCEPVKGGQLRSDFQFIPNLGITNDRTGNSAAQAMENELQLVRVNGKPIAEFITEQCPDGPGKIAISRYERPADYGDSRFEADKEISSIMQSEQKGERPVTHDLGSGNIQCAEDWEPGTHIVQKGENLRAIARTYKVTEQDLVKWNKIQNPNLIEVCQKIWLKQPPANRNISTKGAAVTKPVQHDQQQADDRGGKTVKMQGQEVAQTMAPKTPAKTYDPVRPLAYEYSPADEPTPLPDGSGARIHTVHRGEYIYKIAKMYNCPEECIRHANGMEIEGDVPLSIGQKLVIPECVCVAYGKTYRPSSTATGATAPKGGTVPKQGQTVAKQTERRSLLDEPERPQAYDYEEQPAKPKKDNTYEESSLYGSDESARTAGNRGGTGKSTDSKKEKVQLFREHHVKQGETLGSIASKFRVDASELSQVNGLDPKEPLVPGKVVLIPVDGE